MLKRGTKLADRDSASFFRRFLDRRFEDLLKRPESFARVRGRIRRATMDRFPYAIYFASDGDEVTVYCVMHAARNPESWIRRVSE